MKETVMPAGCNSLGQFLSLRMVLWCGLATVGLVWCLNYDFLLFHTVAELFAVAVGLSLFFVAATVRDGYDRIMLSYLGAGYFWVAMLDVMHTVTYTGINLHPLGHSHAGVQFWLSGRLLEVLLLLSAPLILARHRSTPWAFPLYGAAAAGFYLTIQEGVFPAGYVPVSGLTDFKVYSEYALVGLLVLALVVAYRHRHLMAGAVCALFMASVGLTILSELAFTAYVGVYDLSNAIGHMLKVASYTCLLAALMHQRRQAEALLTDDTI